MEETEGWTEEHSKEGKAKSGSRKDIVRRKTMTPPALGRRGLSHARGAEWGLGWCSPEVLQTAGRGAAARQPKQFLRHFSAASTDDGGSAARFRRPPSPRLDGLTPRFILLSFTCTHASSIIDVSKTGGVQAGSKLRLSSRMRPHAPPCRALPSDCQHSIHEARIGNQRRKHALPISTNAVIFFDLQRSPP